MDVLLVASDPVQRWALADALRLSPGDAVAGDEGVARLLHPCGLAVDAVVQLVTDADDAARLDRLVRHARRPVVAVPTSPSVAVMALAVDADAVVEVDRAAGPREQAAAAARGLEQLGLRDPHEEPTPS